MQIKVHIVPGSSRSDMEKGEPWCVHVHARPVDGKANEELLEVVSRYFGVARSAVCIASGRTSRDKTVDIDLERFPMKEKRG